MWGSATPHHQFCQLFHALICNVGSHMENVAPPLLLHLDICQPEKSCQMQRPNVVPHGIFFRPSDRCAMGALSEFIGSVSQLYSWSTGRMQIFTMWVGPCAMQLFLRPMLVHNSLLRWILSCILSHFMEFWCAVRLKQPSSAVW